jgi:periplasmic copper chaperone A
MRPILPVVLLASFACVACDRAADNAQAPPPSSVATAAPEVRDAWIRLPAVAGRPGAAYFVVQAGAEPVALTAITTPAAERIELHATMMTDGVMRMESMEAHSLAAGEASAFEPGGNHAMLFGLSPDLRPGERVPLTFTFDGIDAITVEAEVRATGETHAGH